MGSDTVGLWLRRPVAALGGVALAWAVAMTAVPGLAQGQGREAADLDALTKAAKAEGEVLFYCAQVEVVAKRVAEAFMQKYGIKASYIRLPSTQLMQRYAAEAEAGNIAADIMFNAGNAVGFAEEGIKKGWVEPLSAAGLPVVRSGQFPAARNNGPTAVIQIGPEHFVYNTEKVRPAEVPKTWQDLLHPRFKGQILIPDPRASDATLDQWVMVLNKYGEGYLKQFNAQVGRRFGSGVPAIQSLAAGEGMLMLPITRPAIDALAAKGAPVAGVIPDAVTGVEMQVMLTARNKSRHPNAARLMANYVMSPEGNKVFNDDPGGFPIYDLSMLPKGYEAPSRQSAAYRTQILNLLGFQ
jgi:iron(III) transport system substrate-binding protein